MAVNTHVLLVIEVVAASQPGEYDVVARREANDGKLIEAVDAYRITWALPPSEERLFAQVRKGLSQAELRQIGSRLFKTLFPENRPIANAYDSLLDPDHPSTLILRFFTPELSRYPWEAMFDSQRHVIERNVPLVRSIRPFNINNREPQPVAQLQVLYASASPENLNHLSRVEELYGNIKSSLQTQAKRGRRIVLDKHLCQAQRGQLATELGKKKHHVICLAMHGTHDHLLLHHERESDVDRLTATDLLKMLKGTPVRLVILVACDTASPAASPELVDFARALLDESGTNLSAVLAMQTPINQQRAGEFIERVFFHLSQFERVDIAVAKARNILSQRDRTSRDTFAPVLYMQTRSGELFRRQINWLLRFVATAAALFAVLFIVSVVLGGINDVRRQFEAAYLEIIGNEQRLQTVAQVSRIKAVSAAASIPLRTQLVRIGNSVWANGQDGILRRYSGLPGEREFFVGVDSYSPIATQDGKYLWVASRHDGTLTRIDSARGTEPLQLHVGSGLEAPFEAGGAIWTQSFVETSLFRIDPADSQITTFFTGFDVHSAFEGGGYVWVLPKGDNRIQRIDAETLNDEAFTIDADVSIGLFAGQSLWVLTNTQELIQYDPETLKPRSSLRFPSPIYSLRAANGNLLAISPESRSITVVNSAQAEVERVYQLSAEPRDTLITENRLWVLTTDDTLVSYDLEQNAPLFTLSLTGEPRLWAAFSDGEMLWLPIEDELLVIRQSDGSKYRQLSLCHNFTKPIYDGVNVWTSCEENGEVRYFPSRMQYFGVERFDGDLYAHLPVVHSNALWLTQEDSGRVLAFNANLPPLSATLGAPLMPLQADGEFLWTAVPKEGRLLRLLPQLEQPTIVRSQPNVALTSSEVIVAGEIQSFHIINDHIWILHTQLDELRQAANLTIVDRVTLEKQEHPLATIPAGLAHVGDRVWVSASGLNDDSIYQFDAITGNPIGDPLSLPDTVYASWPPTQIGNFLYFTAGAPPLNAAGEFMVDLFLKDHASASLKPLLHRYDLSAHKWDKVYDIVPAPYAPLNADPFLWFLSGYLPNDTDRDTGTIFALNPETGVTVSPFMPCRDATMPRVTEQFVWMGCERPDAQLLVFDRHTGQQRIAYEGIGNDPWPPVTHNGYIWITFRESNNAAAFNAENAALVGIFPLGTSPGPPFVYDNDVWVMNSAEGSMQRLRVEE